MRTAGCVPPVLPTRRTWESLKSFNPSPRNREGPIGFRFIVTMESLFSTSQNTAQGKTWELLKSVLHPCATINKQPLSREDYEPIPGARTSSKFLGDYHWPCHHIQTKLGLESHKLSEIVHNPLDSRRSGIPCPPCTSSSPAARLKTFSTRSRSGSRVNRPQLSARCCDSGFWRFGTCDQRGSSGFQATHLEGDLFSPCLT